MTTSSTFEALPLAAPLHRALRGNGYTTPSPIQEQAIPSMLEGKDLLGCAQTGTGKTAAFALPILQRLVDAPRRMSAGRMRYLILTPTRELAVQVADSFAKYGKYVRFSLATVYGGVSQRPQVRALAAGVDVLVATPGRLLDLREQGQLRFDDVEVFVLDEADRMLDMGFINDIKRVLKELPRNRQTFFFSATISSEIKKLAETMLIDPVSVNVSPKVTTAEKVAHSICFLRASDKMSLLSTLLKKESEDPTGQNLALVFSKTKHGANRLAKNLEKAGIRGDAIHGNKSQAARQKSLDRFRSGRTRVLVATDVAARGIDVKNITLVINYDLPMEAEAYVHRIGRTARAGAEGRALSFCSEGEFGLLQGIERLIKQEIGVNEDHPYHAGDLASQYVGNRFRHASTPMRQKNGGRSFGRSGSRGSRGPRNRTGDGSRGQRGRSRADRSGFAGR